MTTVSGGKGASSSSDGSAIPVHFESADIDSVLKAAIQRCMPELDRKLQELTRQGPAASWSVGGNVTDVLQALAALISAASHDTPEGGEITVALSPLERTSTVSSFAAGVACSPSRRLDLDLQS